MKLVSPLNTECLGFDYLYILRDIYFETSNYGGLVGSRLATNFAEEMVYWYLRLNGFFVLQNFVLHSSDLDGNQNADVDLLAIRHRYTYEEVGGQPFDKDETLFCNFDPDKHISIICEVKSGQNPIENSLSLNKIDRLKYALQRIGVFSKEKIQNDHLPNLRKRPITTGNYHQVAKLFISQKPAYYSSCICITLEHIESFLHNHLKRYIDEKSGARLFFPSELMQHMLWSIKQEELRRSSQVITVDSGQTV